MKWPASIHLLKIWDPKTGRIRRRFAFKTSIVLGADRRSDLRLSELEGLAARIDFESGELALLSTGQNFKVTPHKIFTIGPYAILWNPLSRDLISKWKVPVGGAVALVALTTLIAVAVGREPACTRLETRLAKGQWSTRELKPDEVQFLKEVKDLLQSAKRALDSGELVQFQSQLKDLESQIERKTRRDLCGTDRPIEELRLRMRRMMFRQDLEAGNLVEALRLYEQILQTAPSAGQKTMKKELLKASRELFLEGYRLEDEDREKGLLLQDQATEVCQKLGLESCIEGLNQNRESN